MSLILLFFLFWSLPLVHQCYSLSITVCVLKLSGVWFQVCIHLILVSNWCSRVCSWCWSWSWCRTSTSCRSSCWWFCWGCWIYIWNFLSSDIIELHVIIFINKPSWLLLKCCFIFPLLFLSGRFIRINDLCMVVFWVQTIKFHHTSAWESCSEFLN